MPREGDPSSLLPSEMLDRIDHLKKVFHQLCDQSPGLRSHPGVIAFAERFERSSAQFERTRVRIALLGPIEAGPASALLHALGIASSDGGRPPGPTKAPGVVVRSYRKTGSEIDAESWGGHVVRLCYLSTERFRSRRRTACRALGIDPALPDTALLEKAGSIRRRSGDQAGGRPQMTSDLADDCESLEVLLGAYRQFGPDYVRPVPRVDDGDIARVEEYTSFDRSRAPTPLALLDEVEIAYASSAFPERLELVEPAGLGRLLDLEDPASVVLMTGLDGALIFQNAGDSRLGFAREMFRRLRQASPSLTDRTRLVLTRIDQIEPVHGESGFLADLEKFARENRIGPSRVVFLADQRAGNGSTGEIQGDRHPEFAAALESADKDGGSAMLIESLSRVIERAVARAKEEAAADLVSLQASLSDLLRLAEDLAAYDPELFYRAIRGRVSLQGVAGELAIDNSKVEGPALKLAEHLRNFFGRLCPPNLEIPPGTLPRAHRDFARLLSMEASRLAAEMTLRPAFHRVTVMLEAVEAEVGPVPVSGRKSLTDAWNVLATGDLDRPAWYSDQFKAFEDRGLFDDGRESLLSTPQYRDLMLTKIDVVIRRATQVLVRRIERHLLDLSDGLNWLGDAQGLDYARDIVALNRLRDELAGDSQP